SHLGMTPARREQAGRAPIRDGMHEGLDVLARYRRDPQPAEHRLHVPLYPPAVRVERAGLLPAPPDGREPAGFRVLEVAVAQLAYGHRLASPAFVAGGITPADNGGQQPPGLVPCGVRCPGRAMAADRVKAL